MPLPLAGWPARWPGWPSWIRPGRGLAGRLDREVGRRLAGAGSAEQLALLARAVGAVGPWLDEPARRRRVDGLTDRLTRVVRPDSPLADLRALRDAVRALRAWLDPARFDRLCEEFAPMVIRGAVMDRWMTEVQELVKGTLAPLPVGELVAVLRQPSCIGPSEAAALAALGQRVGRQFTGLWAAVRWLRENRPDIDLGVGADALDAARPGG
ncbi:MAG: hypothetical protein U0797_21510 [Gemmataceae bacterium]